MRYLLCLLITFLVASFNYNFAQQAPMFRGNSQLTGVYDTQPIYKLKGVKFTFKTEGPIRSTPAISDNTVYFGSGDGNFYAIDARSGNEIWRFKTGGAVHSSPAIADGSVYFTSRDGYLYVLRASNGKELWKFQFGKDLSDQNYWDYYLSSPNVVDKILYIGGGDGYLYALDTRTKKAVWKHNAGSRIRTTPAVINDRVIFGTMSGYVYAIEKTDGSDLWKFASVGASIRYEDFSNDRTSIFCSPSVNNDIVTVGGREGNLYAIDLATGKEKWKMTQDGQSWILSTGIDGPVVFVGGGSARLTQALDVNSGAEKWRFSSSGVFSSLTIVKDMIYFGDLNGDIHALDKNTGLEKWRFPIGSRSLSTPVISDQVVYCGADDGVLYALQGSAEVDTVTLRAKKVVYWEGKKSEKAYSWFLGNDDQMLRDYFQTAGYELMNAGQLRQFMEDRIKTESSSVVVFADNKIPKTVVAEESENALIRKYLNAGGKIVLFGPNPLAYRTDSVTGVVNSVDFSVPQKVFGIQFPESKFVRGFNGVHVTTEGSKWGLRGFWVSPRINPVDPHQATATLAVDEYGMANSWVKNFGGPEGTGLLQLSLPGSIVGVDLAPIRTAIEYGIGW